MNSSIAREAILSRINKAKDSIVLPDTSSSNIHENAIEPKENSGLVEKFIDSLIALGAEPFKEPSVEHVRQRLKSIISGKKILSWQPQYLPYDMGKLLETENVFFGKEDKDVFAQAEIGLTGCDSALAETGSLVLLSGKGKPRSASLLPYTHVALVERSKILANMGELFDNDRHDLLKSSHINIISGPSRTADIELKLTLGVHGPGKLIVIIGP